MKLSITDLVRGMRDVRPATGPFILAALSAMGLYVFFEIADEVSENEVGRFDDALLLMFRDATDRSVPMGPEWLKETMIEITAMGGIPLLIIIVCAVTGFLLVSRQYGPAIFTFVSILTGTVASHLLKLAYDRPRPDLVEQFVTVHTPSFPSGHATMSAVVYLTLAVLIVRLVDRTAVRVYVVVIATLLTLAIGVSRVYLGVHWPSDVAAGWAFGAAWASLAWLTVSVLRKWRQRENAS